MPLLRWQRNEVFRALEEADLAPQEFEWRGDGAVLVHRPTGYFFRFEPRCARGSLVLRFGRALERAMFPNVVWSPVGERSGSGVATRTARHWTEKRELFNAWAAIVKRESAPDLWATVRDAPSLVEDPVFETARNSPFSADEQEVIRRRFVEVRVHVQAAYREQLSEAQLDAIEARLDYLVEAVPRLGRIDWRNALTGAFLGALAEGILPQDIVRDVITMIGHGIAHLLGAPPPPLPG